MFGEENFFPDSDPRSYESVMASGDLEQRRLVDKMMRGAVRLKSLLEFYKPSKSKYSPEVCRAKEEQWTEKIERSYLDFQEDLYKYKDYIVQYTVEMSTRELSAMSISNS